MGNNFQEYPKRMIHKDHALAVFKPLTEEQQKLKGLFAPVPELLSPARYPDVTVSNIDQEKQYASKGYRPANNANAEEYDRTILDAKTVDGYKFNPFPKWKYHAVQIPVVVKSAEEETSLGEGWEDSPVIASEDDVPEEIQKVAKPVTVKTAAKPKKAKPKAKVKKLQKPVAKPVAEGQPAV